MVKESEIIIGINIGKTNHEDRGITVYTRNILNEFGHLDSNYQFILLNYPNNMLNHKFGINKAVLKSLPHSDKRNPWLTIIDEQVLNPLQQNELKLDVIWHPHNRCQFIVPVGYVCTMHDILPISQPKLADQYLNRFEKKALYLSRTNTANRADSIITGSEFSRREIIKHLDVDPNKVTVIHYGIDQNLFKPNRNKDDLDRIRRTYSLPKRYLLTTGGYAPHKNLHLLVDSYNKSNLAKENIGLVMVGPNDATGYKIGYDQLKEHVQNLEITDKVILLPSVPLNDLITIYSNAEIFAITSLYEGFGFTPLEAMACEIPVVASNASAIPEVCGNAVLYADPHDSSSYSNHFNALIEDKNLRQRLINNGQSQVKKYSWQTTAKKTLDILYSTAMIRK